MFNDCPELFGVPKFHIIDTIHGSIPFFEWEKEVIDHPLFQRLRHIKQNDILQFVFTGATHTRFEHSIGTMHIAGLIFKNMIRSYLLYIKKKGKICSENHYQSIQTCYYCLRLAALLHDVGHFPFSHQFEESEEAKELLKDPSVISAITGNRKIFEDGNIEILSHEHYSVKVADHILKSVDLGDKIKTQDVIGMMEKGRINPSGGFRKIAEDFMILCGFIKEKINNCNIDKIVFQFFKSIISGEIDADKMDYLLRDSFFSGCRYGSYNVDYLIKNLHLGIDYISPEPWIGVCIHKKGIGEFEDFVYSRFRMYLQVYGHKTVVGFKWILKEAISEVIKEGYEVEKKISKINTVPSKEKIENSLMDLEEFESFDDHYLWDKFKYIASHKKDKSACSDLLKRKKLNHVEMLENKANFEKSHKKEILESNGDKNNKSEGEKYRILLQECSSKFSKITPNFENVRLVSYDGKQEKTESISSNTSFFSKFENMTITHYYEYPKWFVMKKSDS